MSWIEWLTISETEPTISPASIPLPLSTNLCTLIPVVWSPLSIVHCIGAAPRYLGNNDGCTFNRWAESNFSSKLLGIMCPNEAVKSRLVLARLSNGGGALPSAWTQHSVDQLTCQMGSLALSSCAPITLDKVEWFRPLSSAKVKRSPWSERMTMGEWVYICTLL